MHLLRFREGISSRDLWTALPFRCSTLRPARSVDARSPINCSGACPLSSIITALGRAPFLPDMIFLDIAMPEMAGYEVARRLRQRADVDHPLIVAVTGFGRDADRQMARDAGFDEHATKPLDPDVLTRLLNDRRDHDM